MDDFHAPLVNLIWECVPPESVNMCPAAATNEVCGQYAHWHMSGH